MTFPVQALELLSHENVVPFRWESRNPSLLNVQRWLSINIVAASKPGQKELESKHPAALPVLVVRGLAALSSLADAIVRAVNDSPRGGLVVDVRGVDIKVLENESLERGQVLVVKRNGEVVSYVCQAGSSRDLAAIMAMPEVPSVYGLS